MWCDDYDFADRNSYSDLGFAYQQLGQSFGNSAYKYCFGEANVALQKNVAPIDEEKDDWRNTFAEDCERWADHAIPIAVDFAKDWAVGATIGAAVTAAAPFVAPAAAVYGAYKYGSKFVNHVASGVRKFVAGRKSAQKASQAIKNTPSSKITNLEKQISEWLGEETKLIMNKANDPVFISNDMTRRVRFDFKNPHGQAQHMHLEIKPNRKWIDATSQHRIFPKEEI